MIQNDAELGVKIAGESQRGEGRLLLGDPASKFLPQLKSIKVAKSPTSETLELVPCEREMTVRALHLLTATG